MELTKLEQAIALSLFIKEMGLDVASELLGEETIAEVEKESINIVETQH